MWSISTHGMARLSTFEAAEKFWNKAKPWKKEDASWRPLDSPRMKHKRLVKTKDGGYACVLFSTALVTYYPDRVELNLHPSISSAAFCYCVGPAGCSITSANGYRFWEVNTPDGSRFYRPDKTLLVLLKQPGNQWRLKSDFAEVTEWVYDRKLGAQARKMLKPYKLWYETSKRLGALLPNAWTSIDATNQGLAMMAEQSENINFLELAYLLGDPYRAIKNAYKLYGAHTQQIVPADRLPQRTRI